MSSESLLMSAPAPLPVSATHSPCQRFWEAHVARLIERSPRTPLGGLSGILAFAIHGPGGGGWTLSMTDGVLGPLESRASDGATATIALGVEDFLGIVSGQLDHQQAFFEGRIEISGDIGLVLSLATMIPLLRERFPFDLDGARRAS